MDDDPRRRASESDQGGEAAGKPELRPPRGRTFLPDLTGVEFSTARRGYDRDEVDRYVERVSRIVVELEAMRSPDAVIERALADVGEETSAILRRARQAGEEIIADAEAQARDTREDADRYRGQVLAHIEQLAQQRQRLIEDLRKLADEFHRTADRALEEIPEQPSHEMAYAAAEGNGDAASTDPSHG